MLCMLSLFLMVGIIKESCLDISGCLLATLVIPFLPKMKLSWTLPTLPLLMRGAYQYHNSLRMLLPFYVAGMALVAIGCAVGNLNLSYATVMTLAFVVGMAVCQRLDIVSVCHYRSAKRMVFMQSFYAFSDGFVCVMPFAVLLLAFNPSMEMFEKIFTGYLGWSLYLLQCECIRYFDILNPIILMLILAVLFAMDGVWIFKVYLFVVPIVVTALLLWNGYYIVQKVRS